MAAPGQESWLDACAALLGRLLLSHIFLLSGVAKILDWPGTEKEMAEKGMVLIPFFMAGAILVELGGGLSLLAGYRARLGALALFLFLIPTTLVFHSFWTYAEPERHIQLDQFIKNIAIMGGLLVLAGRGPGRWSLDPRARGGTPPA
jgi:putative oxidoreductase